jgi:TetR/AcrR family transcriptional regulator, mexJK operon transcriptional repressor
MSAIPRRQLNRQAKEKSILYAALIVFSDLGYSGATMDAIAFEAGLSKPTVYQYFESKERLFTAMMVAKRDDMLVAFERPSAEAMVEQLLAFSWRYANTILRPDLLSLARLIIGEAHRFPEIGRAYQASGPDRVLEGIMAYLAVQRSDGRLEFDDAELAAQDLWGLILSAPRTKALHRPDALPNKAEIARYIHNGLKVFIKAYSTQAETDLKHLQVLCVEDDLNGQLD